MKRLTLIILGVLLCTPLYSDMNPYIAGVPVSGGVTYLVQEDFEGTGTPSGWVQAYHEGYHALPNFDYTTTVLEGSESMYLSGTGWLKDQAVSTPTLTAGDDRYIGFMYRIPTMPTTGVNVITIMNGSSRLAYFLQGVNGRILAKLEGGESVVNPDGVVSADTTYYVKVRYQSGEPAILTVWFSSNGTSWAQVLQTDDTDIASGMTSVSFWSSEGNSFTPIIDLVRIADEDFDF